jgi:hypothetical protein
MNMTLVLRRAERLAARIRASHGRIRPPTPWICGAGGHCRGLCLRFTGRLLGRSPASPSPQRCFSGCRTRWRPPATAPPSLAADGPELRSRGSSVSAQCQGCPGWRCGWRGQGCGLGACAAASAVRRCCFGRRVWPVSEARIWVKTPSVCSGPVAVAQRVIYLPRGVAEASSSSAG